MTHLQLLQQCFPIEVARKIMRFHSHPTADIMRDRINMFKTHEAKWIEHWEGHVRYVDLKQFDFAYWHFERIDDWNEFLSIVMKAKDIYGNSFSYTLIEENDFQI